jgi:hypothetical protein
VEAFARNTAIQALDVDFARRWPLSRISGESAVNQRRRVDSIIGTDEAKAIC